MQTATNSVSPNAAQRFGDSLRPEDMMSETSSTGSRRSSANSGASSSGQSIANTVVNSLLSGAAAVGSYVWSFWSTSSPDPDSSAPQGEMTKEDQRSSVTGFQNYKHSKSDVSGIIDSLRGSGRSSVVGHKRAVSNPEKLSQALYLDDADYGIRLIGRSATGEDALLTPNMISKIHAGLPSRFRLCNNWRLIYSTPEHGFSLGTLFSQCKAHDGPTLTVVRDDGDALFGVFATEAWRPHFGHYGTGECFLWRVEKSADDTRIRKYSSSGKNAYFMISERSYLAAGCGEGKFGIWLDEELLNGQSSSVPTFDNDCLASAERFKCINLEVWGLDMTPLNDYQ